MQSLKIPKRYNPKKVEKKWYSFWEKKGYFIARCSSKKPKYTIMMPPPNVTGILHLGHVLNLTLQDAISRAKRMQGYEVLWLPGTDHAGIATQNKVEQSLSKEGKTRFAIGREKFIKRVWEWKNRHGGIILDQIRYIGASCDWSRLRFTMDQGLSEAVLEAFVRLYEKGLIYRGEYIVNWCPRCESALSDEEVESNEINGKLYYIKYPIEENCYISVATTRPETMLGDTGVAVNPKDERYKKLIGKRAKLPFLSRLLPIISDERVDREFGTGAVKVTPAHDRLDFEISEDHGLERIVIMDKKGVMNENAGPFKGLSRETARKRIVDELKKEELLEKIEEYKINLGSCYRCETVVEPYLSEQWFLRMKPLAKKALNVLRERKIVFYPMTWENKCTRWLDNIRDWCISRQIWWGHRIPVYTCKKCGNVVVKKKYPSKCPKCGSSRIIQDEDVLDTWFSSWLWPFSTLGWPGKTEDLQTFYPTQTLVTAWEILFFWVVRMIMAGLEFTDSVPFKNIVIHGMVRDKRRRKLSKSLGNSPDPVKLFEQYGTDAVRFSMGLITPEGRDVIFSEKKMEIGRNFANKLWNAFRLLASYPQDNIPAVGGAQERLELEDKWILMKLDKLIEQVTQKLDSFEFTDIAWELYSTFWSFFCDWYLEVIKPRLQGAKSRPYTLGVTFHFLKEYLKLLHPFMPFITEEIYQMLPLKDKRESIILEDWPKKKGYSFDKEEGDFEFIKKFVEEVRIIRGEYGIPLQKKLKLFLRWKGMDTLRKTVIDKVSIISQLVNIEEVDFVENPVKESAAGYIKGVEIYIPLKGIIDIEEEKARISKEIESLTGYVKKIRNRLSSEEFLQKAPSKVVSENEKKLSDFNEKIEKLKKHLNSLKS